jgi:hypothetical protein
MAMKKTSGGDFPLRQGAGKSLWTLSIFRSTTAVDHDVFWKSDRVLRFFLPGGLYRRRGDVRGGPRCPHTMVTRPRPGPRHPCVSLAYGPSPTPLRISGSFRVKYDFRNLFRPIPRIFPVYHFRNTKIAENRELALWQLVNRLVPKNA